MEMLNIPPAKPQTNPTTAPNGNANKGENSSFQNVLGKANQNAKNNQQKGSVNSTGDEGTEFDGTPQLGDEVTDLSQPIVSAKDEESSTELDAEDTASVEFAMGATPGLPIEPGPAHKAEPTLMGSNNRTVVEDAKPAERTPLLSEANVSSTKEEVTSANQGASETNATPVAASKNAPAKNAATDVADQNRLDKNVAPVTASPAASMANIAPEVKPTQATTIAMSEEPLPIAKKDVADSAFPAEPAHSTAAAGPRQKQSVPANSEAITTQTMLGQASEQRGKASSENSKQTGLMESSLGSLLQEVRPLREQSRGRLAANLNRSETASIVISTEQTSQVVAGTQNEDSHLSFASKQENGFSAVQSDAAATSSNPATSGTPFETVLESGVLGSPMAQQVSHPLQAASAETGSIRLASGELLSDDQIVNQVLDRISVERAGNQSRIVIRMNPEELGEVKLSLTLEKDQLKAQLLTQNQQVQELLEKHLPKLHEALSQQGVKLEDIQVGVDSNRHSGQEAFANHRQRDSFRRHFNAPAGINNNDPVNPATASARSVSTEGLSLRV